MRTFSRFFRMKSSNLFEYFYYFFLAAVIIIFILGSVLYFYFSSVLRNEAIDANNNTLEQLKNAQELILTEVDKSVANIVLDPIFSSFPDYYKRDKWSIMVAQDKITNIIVANEYIESLFIYYANDNTVLSYEQGVIGEDNFYDNDFIKSLDYKNIKGDEVRSREKKVYGTERTCTVFSFIKPIPLNYSGSPKAIVVVNIKGVYLQNMFNSIKTNSQSNITIMDKDGKVISQKNNSEMLQFNDIQKEIQLEKNSKRGYFIKKINGSKMLVSNIYSEKYKWMYVYSISMSAITKSIRFLGVVTILFCILLIIISLIGSFFISRRIYSPIKVIMGLINKSSEHTPSFMEDEKPAKETAIIVRNIHSLIDSNKNLADKNRSLEILLYDYEIYQKNKFLKNLAEGTLEGDKKISERLSYYNMNFSENGYFAAFVVSIDNYESFINEYSEKQQNMLFIYISECAQKHIFENYKGFIVETNLNEIVIIVNLDTASGEDAAKSNVYNLANRIHEVINENMKYTFTLGVSAIHQKTENIHICYREGASAANFRLLLGHNNVIFYENIKFHTENKGSYPFSIERNIINGLKAGDLNGVITALDEFKGYILYNIGENIEFVRHYFLQLMSATMKCMYELDMDLESIPVTEKDIYSAIVKMETVQGMQTYIRNIYESVLKFTQQQRSIKNSELVSTITTFINNNLASDLSMVKLAEKFYISSSHLRKIFKDETGTTIKEYIDEARIKKAQELLQSSHIKIYDISERVGYQTIQAFTRAFKISTGKTPGEYRTQCVKNSVGDEIK